MSEQELIATLIENEKPIFKFADGGREYTIWPKGRIEAVNSPSEVEGVYLLHNGIGPLIENAVLRTGEFRELS